MLPFNEDQHSACIQNFVIDNKDWDWTLLFQIVPPCINSENDSLVWKKDQVSTFAIQSSYLELVQNSWNEK